MYLADIKQGFALSAQEPWIQNATIRDNILFGLPYNADKYNVVIFASALQPVRTDLTKHLIKFSLLGPGDIGGW